MPLLQRGRLEEKELFIGDVIQASIQDDLRVESVLFTEGSYLDIGNHDDLVTALRNMNS